MGIPAWMPGIAALGHGWPFAAAHGAMPECGHAEPRRGTEWWGMSVLLTFALFKSEPPSGRNPKPPLPQQWISYSAKTDRPPSRASSLPQWNASIQSVFCRSIIAQNPQSAIEPIPGGPSPSLAQNQ
ncbi:hypothetical protein B1219_21630 [Pseudomonas ogarae]|nr:hypothetical protein B1219_21630 [Pseudomonas ogarae]